MGPRSRCLSLLRAFPSGSRAGECSSAASSSARSRGDAELGRYAALPALDQTGHGERALEAYQQPSCVPPPRSAPGRGGGRLAWALSPSARGLRSPGLPSSTITIGGGAGLRRSGRLAPPIAAVYESACRLIEARRLLLRPVALGRSMCSRALVPSGGPQCSNPSSGSTAATECSPRASARADFFRDSVQPSIRGGAVAGVCGSSTTSATNEVGAGSISTSSSVIRKAGSRWLCARTNSRPVRQPIPVSRSARPAVLGVLPHDCAVRASSSVELDESASCCADYPRRCP